MSPQPQDTMSTQDSIAPNSTTETARVRMSECLQNGEAVNPFENSQLECGQIDTANGNGSYTRFGGFPQYSLIRKHDLWSKVKQAAKRHCNEYRVAVFILAFIIIIGFSILIHLNRNRSSPKITQQVGVNEASDLKDSCTDSHGLCKFGDCDLATVAMKCPRKCGKCGNDPVTISKICNGEAGCCNENNKCGEMDGDCDSDSDCKEGLVCGDNNCKIKSGGKWDYTDDCCYNPQDTSNVTSSSVHAKKWESWGPHLVIDGKLSKYDKGVFRSELEDHPWLQWRLPRTVKMTGITIKNRIDCCGDHLRDVEIRAGKLPLSTNRNGRINVNEICGTFPGPGEDGEHYTIECENEIDAEYVTVQILDDTAILSINDISILTAPGTQSCTGGDSCCTTGLPCGEWEGDCDSDNQCQDGLICGHNNCPQKVGPWHQDWDLTDDCCYRPRNDTGSAISSSTYLNDTERWGPENAIDGLWSASVGYLFRSNEEDMPWIQWHLPKTTSVAGIMISNRNSDGGELLKHVEIRAGSAFLDQSLGFTGKININELCGTFVGPGSDRRVYTVMCEKEILADYVSLQILDLKATLQINELEIITKPEAQNMGCSCHEYMNQNGYGQCKRKDYNQEHVQNLHVCYVDQPSNCTDLYASITDPGRKLSAQACPKDIAPETTTYGPTYKCYHYTLQEEQRIYSEKDNQAVCEGNGPDFVWTKGDVTKTPGCPWGCWCCQKV